MVPEEHALPAVQFAWRGEVTDEELVALTQSHGGKAQAGWWGRIRPHSLGWVTARLSDGTLIGFVNVAWDGGDHAFVIDTKVRPDRQRLGVGTELVRIAAHHAKDAGCEWLEVDFDEPLAAFYYDACGFASTPGFCTSPICILPIPTRRTTRAPAWPAPSLQKTFVRSTFPYRSSRSRPPT